MQSNISISNTILLILREAIHSNYSTTTQVYSLPGCVKRDPIEIKDDKIVPNNNSISRMFKMTKEYNADFIQGKEAEPIENTFPSQQRFGSSFRSRPKTQLYYTQQESKDEESQLAFKSKNNQRQYHHITSHIFDNNRKNNNCEGNYIINSYNTIDNNDKKGRRHFNKETFKSHLEIE